MNPYQFHWTVPADHPAFAGHFPDRPIVPGVVLLDWLLLALADNLPGITPATLAGISIGTTKFLSPALPGETLHFSLQEKSAGHYQFSIASIAASLPSKEGKAARSVANGNFSLPVIAS